VGDLFPGAVLPPTDYGELSGALERACEHRGLQKVPWQFHKARPARLPLPFAHSPSQPRFSHGVEEGSNTEADIARSD